MASFTSIFRVNESIGIVLKSRIGSYGKNFFLYTFTQNHFPNKCLWKVLGACRNFFKSFQRGLNWDWGSDRRYGSPHPASPSPHLAPQMAPTQAQMYESSAEMEEFDKYLKYGSVNQTPGVLVLSGMGQQHSELDMVDTNHNYHQNYFYPAQVMDDNKYQPVSEYSQEYKITNTYKKKFEKIGNFFCFTFQKYF
ncbi:unnamed protein product [Nesidiocoris tenuis]|uniref:Uncharacterized protein n=1 Tax=Nesidiocoris tenuis TaxID=355587 RepID=A0A6H5HYZ4_9HEMI|nr:unnamed protein product [Nesidiocoris tenuis]